MVKRPARRDISDERLVAACLDGDERSWQLLVERYKALVYSIPLRAGLSEDEAADVFQETCLALFRNLHRLRSAPSVAAWLSTTAARLSWAAKSARSRKVDDPTVQGLQEAPLAETELELLERRHALGLALARLPKRCRELIEALMLEPDPPSYGEISSRLGIPVGSVGPTRARCLEKLRTLLRRMGYES